MNNNKKTTARRNLMRLIFFSLIGAAAFGLVKHLPLRKCASKLEPPAINKLFAINPASQVSAKEVVAEVAATLPSQSYLQGHVVQSNNESADRYYSCSYPFQTAQPDNNKEDVAEQKARATEEGGQQ